MKRRVKVLVIMLCSVMLLVVGGSIAYKQAEQKLLGLVNLPVKHAFPATLVDGTYEGMYATFPIKVRVQVQVADQRVQKIALLEHRNGQGSAASVISDAIVANQSLAVDTVCGATYSSIVILKAVEQALAKADKL